MDVAGGHALRIQRDHVAGQPIQPALVFRHRLRFERPVAVPRDRQLDITDVGRDGLARRPVRGVAAPAAGRVVRFVTEMIGELDLEAGLQDLADHRRQQAVVAGELDTLARARATSCSAHSRIAGVSPATNGTLRAAGTNDISSEERREVMNMILPSPPPPAADPQITSLTQSSLTDPGRFRPLTHSARRRQQGAPPGNHSRMLEGTFRRCWETPQCYGLVSRGLGVLGRRAVRRSRTRGPWRRCALGEKVPRLLDVARERCVRRASFPRRGWCGRRRTWRPSVVERGGLGEVGVGFVVAAEDGGETAEVVADRAFSREAGHDGQLIGPGCEPVEQRPGILRVPAFDGGFGVRRPFR